MGSAVGMSLEMSVLTWTPMFDRTGWDSKCVTKIKYSNEE